MKSAVNILLVLFCLYLVLCLGLYLFQSKLIFVPQKISNATLKKIKQQFPGTEIYFKTLDGALLHGWFLPAKNLKAPLVIYFGGNAEEVSGNVTDKRRVDTVSALFINYRGYGLSTGTPSAENFFKDALFIYDSMLAKGFKPEQIVLVGRSLGTGVAVYLASQRQVARVLLVSPYDSLKAVAQNHYPYVPISLLLKHRFDSGALAPAINSPLKMILASTDDTVPHDRSLNLFKLWQGPKEQVTINGAIHNNLQNFDAYWQEVIRFVGR